MLKRCLSILLIMIFTSVSVEAQSNTSKAKVQQQKQETSRKLKQNTRQFELNKAETAKKLRELSLLQEEIKSLNTEIDIRQANLDTLNVHISLINDSIAEYTGRLENLASKYAAALRKQQGSMKMASSVSYIFSSKNVAQMIRKYRALKNFSKWRARKAQEIEGIKDKLKQQQLQLNLLQKNQLVMLAALDSKKKELQESETKNKSLIETLNKKSKEIKSIIEQNQKELKKLDEQLEKIIAEEQARLAEEKRREEERLKREEEERIARLKQQEEQEKQALQKDRDSKNNTKTSKKDKNRLEKNNKKKEDKPQSAARIHNNEPVKQGNLTSRNSTQINQGFLAARGTLPYPVDGKYIIVRGFGRQKHPSLPMIETENPGIDISVDKSAMARSVYEGTVSAIFKQPGYNNVVMVRHGDYITIYANLDNVQVKKGERVAPGQILGKIAKDDDDVQGRSILHFEIRHEKEKENPTLWLR